MGEVRHPQSYECLFCSLSGLRKVGKFSRVPQEGGSWFVEGWWGFPYLKKFIGLLVSWFLGCLVSKSQSFKDSANHIMLVDRCWPHITNISSHAFWKRVIPYPRFPIICTTDLHDVSVPVFSNIFKNTWFPTFEGFRYYYCSKMIWIFLDYLRSLVSPKIRIVGLGSHGHVRKCRNHDNEGFHVHQSKSC